MKEQNAKELIQLINGTLAEQISKTVKRNLGVDTLFVATARYSNYSGWYLDIEETSSAATSQQLTKTKLLRAMFNSASLYLKAWLDEKDNILYFSTSISYSHTHGGHNGLSNLLDFQINLNNNKVRVLK